MHLQALGLPDSPGVAPDFCALHACSEGIQEHRGDACTPKSCSKRQQQADTKARQETDVLGLVKALGKEAGAWSRVACVPPWPHQPIVLPPLLTLSCLPRKASCSLVISVSASPRPEEALNTALCSSKSM